MKTLREIVLGLPIDTPQLGISVRAQNALRNAFAKTYKNGDNVEANQMRRHTQYGPYLVVPTVEEIITIPEDKLMMVRNMGVHSVAEIAELRELLRDQ